MDLLELELQMVVNHHIELGIKLGSFVRPASIFNLCNISSLIIGLSQRVSLGYEYELILYKYNETSQDYVV